MNTMQHSATRALQVRLPDLTALAFGAQYALDDIPNRGFNTLWGLILADQTFTVTISHESLAGTEGPTVVQNSVIDPVTGLNVVVIQGLHFIGNLWNILIVNTGGNPMTQLEYFLHMKP